MNGESGMHLLQYIFIAWMSALEYKLFLLGHTSKSCIVIVIDSEFLSFIFNQYPFRYGNNSTRFPHVQGIRDLGIFRDRDLEISKSRSQIPYHVLCITVSRHRYQESLADLITDNVLLTVAAAAGRYTNVLILKCHLCIFGAASPSRCTTHLLMNVNKTQQIYVIQHCTFIKCRSVYITCDNTQCSVSLENRRQ